MPVLEVGRSGEARGGQGPVEEKMKPATADHRASLDPPKSVEEAPVWLARLLQWAHECRVTDLHLFPSDGRAMVWARIDGELREVACYSPSVHERIMARLKVLGRCSDYTGELVQEGRFTLNGHAEQGEARLSVLPTLRGEGGCAGLMSWDTRRGSPSRCAAPWIAFKG